MFTLDAIYLSISYSKRKILFVLRTRYLVTVTHVPYTNKTGKRRSVTVKHTKRHCVEYGKYHHKSKKLALKNWQLLLL